MAAHVIHTIVQLYGLVPVVPIGIGCELVVTSSLCRIFVVATEVHITNMQFLTGDVVKVVLCRKGLCGIVFLSQVRNTLGA